MESASCIGGADIEQEEMFMSNRLADGTIDARGLDRQSVRNQRTVEAAVAMSRLGFGLSKLMRIPSRTKRQRLLETVYDQGIRHFDVARMYGLGASEKELGHFIRSRRSRVTIATKFGIEPTLATHCMAYIQSPVRWLFTRFPGLKTVATETRQSLYRPKQFTPDAVRTSLEISLRKLKTDYVDILFLHDPMPVDYIASELSDCLKDLQAQGKLRAFGMSSTASSLMTVIGQQPALTSVLQFDNDATSRQIDRLDLPPHATLFTFAPFATALPVVRARCEQTPSVIANLTDRIGIDLRSSQEQIRFLLSYAFHANPKGTVVFASTNVDHVTTITNHVHGGMLKEGEVHAIIEELLLHVSTPVF